MRFASHGMRSQQNNLILVGAVRSDKQDGCVELGGSGSNIKLIKKVLSYCEGARRFVKASMKLNCVNGCGLLHHIDEYREHIVFVDLTIRLENRRYFANAGDDKIYGNF
jgi:hypothetical protein